jgi:transposase
MYSKAFRALMIQKMTDPERPAAQSLADEIGVSRSSLYRWVSEADTLEIAASVEPPTFTESMQRLTNMKRPQDWSAEEKLAAVLEAASLSEEELGAFLRSRGLHDAQLQ